MSLCGLNWASRSPAEWSRIAAGSGSSPPCPVEQPLPVEHQSPLFCGVWRTQRGTILRSGRGPGSSAGGAGSLGRLLGGGGPCSWGSSDLKEWKVQPFARRRVAGKLASGGSGMCSL